MKKNILAVMTCSLFSLFILSSCINWGTNPLVFNGSSTGDTLRVDTQASTFYKVKSVDLNKVRSDIADVDSVKFYNLTILIDSTSGTPAGTHLSGFMVAVNSLVTDTVVTLSGASVADFATERSIFDKTLPALKLNGAGVLHLFNAISLPTPPVVTFIMGASSDNTPLHFTVKIKVYGQIYTKPKN